MGQVRGGDVNGQETAYVLVAVGTVGIPEGLAKRALMHEPCRPSDRAGTRVVDRVVKVEAAQIQLGEREFVNKGTIDVATIRIWLRDPVGHHSRRTT